MAAAIIVGFLLAIAAVVWAVVVALSEDVTRSVRVLYLGCVIAAAIAAYFTTFRYTYFTNENTRFHGWPVPMIVFQRDNPKSPWLDFVGPTTLLAYPMNLILFVSLPSMAVLFLAHRSRKRSREHRMRSWRETQM